jgi:hypothetical protein
MARLAIAVLVLEEASPSALGINWRLWENFHGTYNFGTCFC